MQEAVKSRQHAVDQFRRFSYAIVGVVVAIEALVVFLTMMGSVSERTREIGVFRAIGFRRVHITRLILIEALIASIVAGVLGYVAGMARHLRGAAAASPRSAEVAWAPLLGARRRRAGRGHRRPGLAVSGASRRQDGSRPRRCARCDARGLCKETRV